MGGDCGGGRRRLGNGLRNGVPRGWVLTFADALTFHWNGDEIRVTHVAPAHTDGDSVVRFVKADVVHMGDLFFNGTYPFVDTSSGGRIDGVIAAADRVLALAGPGTRVIPGHGLRMTSSPTPRRSRIGTICS